MPHNGTGTNTIGRCTAIIRVIQIPNNYAAIFRAKFWHPEVIREPNLGPLVTSEFVACQPDSRFGINMGDIGGALRLSNRVGSQIGEPVGFDDGPAGLIGGFYHGRQLPIGNINSSSGGNSRDRRKDNHNPFGWLDVLRKPAALFRAIAANALAIVWFLNAVTTERGWGRWGRRAFIGGAGIIAILSFFLTGQWLAP
jgi:hypothetical protein